MESCRDQKRRMQRALGTEQRETHPFPPPSAQGKRPAAKVLRKNVPARSRGQGDWKGGGARLQPAPKGSPRDSKLEARRRDSDRGSWEEEPEVAAGGSGPGEGRARGGSGPEWRREVGLTPWGLRRSRWRRRSPLVGGSCVWWGTGCVCGAGGVVLGL